MPEKVTIPGFISQGFINPDQKDLNDVLLQVECKSAGQVSDGYHTFDELYEHRCLLFCAFLLCHGGWKCRTHADGSVWDGWFIAGTTVGEQQITYHLPDRLWALCRVFTYETPPEWDGHTSGDVIQRLTDYLSDTRSSP